MENRRYVPLGATAKFRAAAVHGIMTMTRGKGRRYALTASVCAAGLSSITGRPPGSAGEAV